MLNNAERRQAEPSVTLTGELQLHSLSFTQQHGGTFIAYSRTRALVLE